MVKIQDGDRYTLPEGHNKIVYKGKKFTSAYIRKLNELKTIKGFTTGYHDSFLSFIHNHPKFTLAEDSLIDAVNEIKKPGQKDDSEKERQAVSHKLKLYHDELDQYKTELYRPCLIVFFSASFRDRRMTTVMLGVDFSPLGAGEVDVVLSKAHIHTIPKFLFNTDERNNNHVIKKSFLKAMSMASAQDHILRSMMAEPKSETAVHTILSDIINARSTKVLTNSHFEEVFPGDPATFQIMHNPFGMFREISEASWLYLVCIVSLNSMTDKSTVMQFKAVGGEIKKLKSTKSIFRQTYLLEGYAEVFDKIYSFVFAEQNKDNILTLDDI